MFVQAAWVSSSRRTFEFAQDVVGAAADLARDREHGALAADASSLSGLGRAAEEPVGRSGLTHRTTGREPAHVQSY